MKFTAVLLAGLAIFAASASALDYSEVGGYEWDSVVDLVVGKNDTTALENLVVSSGLVDTFAAVTNETATVFIPIDPFLGEALETVGDVDVDTLVQVLSYHVVPGQALLLGDLQDGDVLQTLVPGPEGQLEVQFGEFATKPSLITTSGQTVPIYQYNIQAGNVIVHTIKGLLQPGTQTFAPAPTAA
jgi:uncharacterized surface protein with fasciclin (FAS1) repeats